MAILVLALYVIIPWARGVSVGQGMEVINCENFWYVLSLGMEDMLSLAYGAAGNMALMIITVTAV